MMLFKLFAIAFPAFMILDMTWIGFISNNFYKKHLGYLLAENVTWWAAIVFYVLFVCGLIMFVIKPAIEKGSLYEALLMGAFFGIVTYAAYDLTNQALTKDWPWIVTVVDMAWGAFIAMAVSGITYKVHDYFS